MKRKALGVIVAASAFFLCAGHVVIGKDVGRPAKGGQPEYLFINKVPKAQAEATAQIIGSALAKGRMVIFAHMGKIGDPNLGDKGFTAEYFAENWLKSLEPELIEVTPEQKPILDRLVSAGKQSIANNQDRLNVKGVAWKNFLPAKWARETGQVLNSTTGIVTKQPARYYRHPANAPDEIELRVLNDMIKPGVEAKPRGEFGMMGKQKVYRYFEPVQLITPCLSCHGKPKGELDPIGYEKDGLEAGDVVGLISVVVPYED